MFVDFLWTDALSLFPQLVMFRQAIEMLFCISYLPGELRHFVALIQFVKGSVCFLETDIMVRVLSLCCSLKKMLFFLQVFFYRAHECIG